MAGKTVKKSNYLVYGTAVPDILNSAQKYDVPPWVALSMAIGEGGLNYGSVGDNGSSYGPYQLHVGGALPAGKGEAWANSPEGIDYAMRQIKTAIGTANGLDAITVGVEKFERPANPGPEISNDYNWYLKQVKRAAGRPPTAAAKGYHPITSAQEALQGSASETLFGTSSVTGAITSAVSGWVSGIEGFVIRGGKILLGIVLIVAVVFLAIR